jgi:hypothetical protein
VRAIGGDAMATAVLGACRALVGLVEVVAPRNDGGGDGGSSRTSKWPAVRLVQPEGFLRENVALTRILAALDDPP